MQTTLLGLAIAIILALVSALIAPLVIDWNRYRATFEQEATRLTGLDVRVNGAIDARILPSPRINVRNVQIGAGAEPAMRAAALELELGLGPLLRGEVRASELRLVQPQISLGLAPSGALDWPGKTPSFRLDTLAISRLSVEDGRVVLTDAVSGTRLTLQKLWFSGDVRAFSAAFRGDGAVVVGDELYAYRISGSRAEESEGWKLRLGIDPSDYPLTADIEGTLGFARAVPQFTGTLALARPAGAALARGQRVVNDPWHLAGRLQATPATASLQDLVFQYGPDERALNFNGKAELTLGAKPRLDGAITARQVDIDRAVAAPDMTHRPPFLVVKQFFEALVAAVKPPVPAKLGVGMDALVVGGTVIESLHGNLSYDDRGWSVDGVEFRAPGFSELRLSGRIDETARGLAFAGPASLESADLKTLLAWIGGRSEPPAGPSKALTARGDITIAADRFAIDRLAATIDQENVEGRLVYTWPADNRPAALDGELRAAEIDADALIGFAKAAVADSFDLPRAVALSIDVGKATLAGVDARTIKAGIKFDSGVLHIDRLSVGDLGGAALNVSGRIDELSSRPRGRLTFDLDAKALGGLTKAVGKVAPQAADSFHRFADRLAPAKVHGALTVERAAVTAPEGSGTVATFDFSGQMGALRIALNGDAKGERDRLGEAVVRVGARLDADDGGAVARVFGLDRVVAVDQLPGQIKLSAAGPLNGDVRIDALASAGGLAGTATGALRLSGERALTGSLQVKVSAADLRPLHHAMTGQPGIAVPVSAQGSIAIAGADLSLTNLAVTAGKTSLRGHVAGTFSAPMQIDGDIEADDVDATAAIALLLGLPGAPSGATGFWSGEPIRAGAFGPVNGTLTFKLNRAAFTPALVARDLAGAVRLEPSAIALNDLDGRLAGGRLTGDLTFRHDAGQLGAQGHIELAGAEAGSLLAANTRALDGLVSAKLQADGMGLSPASFIGSLHGGGTITLADAHFGGIDPAAFAAATRAADPNGAIDASKVRTVVAAAMQNGRLAVPHGDAQVTIAGGQIRLANTALQTQGGAELAIGGNVDLSAASIDARMVLSQPPAANALISSRPELSIAIKGPLAAPERTIDLSALVAWLTLQSAELQTRRLESIEANRRPEVLGAAVHPIPPAVRFLPPGTALESAVPASPLGPFGARGLDHLRPEALIAPDETRSDAEGLDRGGTAALPSPLEIKPAAPRSLARPDSATANAGNAEPYRRHSPLAQPTPPQAAPSQPQAPASRSPFDILFRSQN